MSNRKQRRNRAIAPKNVNGQITARTEFYKVELFSMVKGLFKVKQDILWDRDYVLNTLLTRGYILISDTPVGIVPCHGSLSGLNYWNLPTHAEIELPTIGSFKRTLHVDCEVIYLERTRLRNFYTFNNLIDVYAYKLAAADAGIDVNLFNTRIAYVAEAESKAQATTIKEMYEDITEGKPLVVYKSGTLSKEGFKLWSANVKQNFVADLIQDSKRTIINEFLTRLGINNANTDKKERLVTNEVDANNVELRANVETFKANLKICNKRVTRIFPELDFEIKLKFDPKKLQSSAAELANKNPIMEEGSNNDTMGRNGNMGTR